MSLSDVLRNDTAENVITARERSLLYVGALLAVSGVIIVDRDTGFYAKSSGSLAAYPQAFRERLAKIRTNGRSGIVYRLGNADAVTLARETLQKSKSRNRSEKMTYSQLLRLGVARYIYTDHGYYGPCALGGREKSGRILDVVTNTIYTVKGGNAGLITPLGTFSTNQQSEASCRFGVALFSPSVSSDSLEVYKVQVHFAAVFEPRLKVTVRDPRYECGSGTAPPCTREVERNRIALFLVENGPKGSTGSRVQEELRKRPCCEALEQLAEKEDPSGETTLEKLLRARASEFEDGAHTHKALRELKGLGALGRDCVTGITKVLQSAHRVDIVKDINKLYKLETGSNISKLGDEAVRWAERVASNEEDTRNLSPRDLGRLEKSLEMYKNAPEDREVPKHWTQHYPTEPVIATFKDIEQKAVANAKALLVPTLGGGGLGGGLKTYIAIRGGPEVSVDRASKIVLQDFSHLSQLPEADMSAGEVATTSILRSAIPLISKVEWHKKRYQCAITALNDLRAAAQSRGGESEPEDAEGLVKAYRDLLQRDSLFLGPSQDKSVECLETLSQSDAPGVEALDVDRSEASYPLGKCMRDVAEIGKERKVYVTATDLLSTAKLDALLQRFGSVKGALTPLQDKKIKDCRAEIERYMHRINVAGALQALVSAALALPPGKKGGEIVQVLNQAYKDGLFAASGSRSLGGAVKSLEDTLRAKSGELDKEIGALGASLEAAQVGAGAAAASSKSADKGGYALGDRCNEIVCRYGPWSRAYSGDPEERKAHGVEVEQALSKVDLAKGADGVTRNEYNACLKEKGDCAPCYKTMCSPGLVPGVISSDNIDKQRQKLISLANASGGRAKHLLAAVDRCQHHPPPVFANDMSNEGGLNWWKGDPNTVELTTRPVLCDVSGTAKPGTLGTCGDVLCFPGGYIPAIRKSADGRAGLLNALQKDPTMYHDLLLQERGDDVKSFDTFQAMMERETEAAVRYCAAANPKLCTASREFVEERAGERRREAREDNPTEQCADLVALFKLDRDDLAGEGFENSKAYVDHLLRKLLAGKSSVDNVRKWEEWVISRWKELDRLGGNPESLERFKDFAHEIERAKLKACLAAGLTETGKFGIEKGGGYVKTQAKKIATLGRRLTRKVLPF